MVLRIDPVPDSLQRSHSDAVISRALLSPAVARQYQLQSGHQGEQFGLGRLCCKTAHEVFAPTREEQGGEFVSRIATGISRVPDSNIGRVNMGQLCIVGFLQGHQFPNRLRKVSKRASIVLLEL